MAWKFIQGKPYNLGGSSYWTQRWAQTNPDTDVATYQLDQTYDIVTQHTLFGANADMWDNNIKYKTYQSTGGWIFSFVDVRVLTNAFHGGNPINNRAWGLVDSTNQNGVFFFRASGNTANISYKIVQGGDVKYTYDSDIANFAQVKITINASNEIVVYQLVNDAWVQIGVTQTYALGALTLFMATGGTNATKTTLSDWHLFTTDTFTSYPASADTGYLDIRDYGAVPDGTTDCSAAINAALADGNIVIKNGVFKYTDSGKIPSNRTVLIRNAKYVQADTNFDNFFRNEDLDNGNTNIKIIGKGCAVLDANFANNNDAYETYSPGGLTSPPADLSYRYIGTFFCQVDNFEFKNITYVDYMHWSTCLQSCSYGTIDNIYFSMITTGNYNQDGIAQLYLNHHHTITNIRGYTGDDFFSAGTGLNIPIAYKHTDWRETGDQYSITYENIWAYRGGQRFQLHNAGDGYKIHDISYTNIYVDACGSYLLSLSLPTSIAPPTVDDYYNITFDNFSIEHCANALIYCQSAGQNITLTNFTNNTGSALMYNATLWSKTIYNFSINGVLYPPPLLVTATVENGAKDTIILTYDRLMDDASVSDPSSFTPSDKTAESVAINKVAKTCTIVVDTEYIYGNVITLGYIAPLLNKLKGYLSGDVADFVDQAVTNNIVSGFPTDGLVARWDMNGNTEDSTVNGYDLTNANCVLCPDENAVADKAYDFVPGSSPQLYRNTFTEARNNEFTAAIKFKADSLTNFDCIIGYVKLADFTAGWGVHWNSATNSLRFWINGWNTAARFVDIPFTDTASWHMLVVSFKPTLASNQIKMNLDGGAEYNNGADYHVNPAYATAGTEFQMGKRGGSGYCDMKVSFAALWNRELGDSEKNSLGSYYL